MPQASTGIASSARSQSSSGPRIAYLSGRSAATDSHLLDAFREGLKTAGFVDGQNVTMDIRWADGRYGDMAKMAAEVVATKPDLIVAVGGNPVGLAAKQATSTIPVVFGAGADPVKIGLVANLNRPEGNLTGMTLWANELDAKRLDLLHDMLPKARTVAVLMNPDNPGYEELLPRTRRDCRAPRPPDQAPDRSRQLGGSIAPSSPCRRARSMRWPSAPMPFSSTSRARILALANERTAAGDLPGPRIRRRGGLVSYGTRWADMYRSLGSYAGRILKGAKVAELPVQRPTNYRAGDQPEDGAQARPRPAAPHALTRADEVIE